ncbi:unnamed protein product [Macrosiphum euphorbiae]|uniref:Uncharacterized protein n=1 Tax=Macrosiphum euphorbiae TaxID=13131 RepID=A0AAV0Y650_9HEMI|nr:unnamed protein product [Macrosiphum euphorbiae]
MQFAEAPVDGCAALAAAVVCAYKLDVEQIRREILSGGRGRRARSEQGPHPRNVQQQQHLWPGVDRPQPVGRQTNVRASHDHAGQRFHARGPGAQNTLVVAGRTTQDPKVSNI